MGGADLRFPSDPKLPFYMWQNLGGCIIDSLGLDVVVVEKDINDIVVFGHTNCGIITTGLCGTNSDCFSEEVYRQLCERTEKTRVATKDRFGEKFDGEVQIKATRDFVLRQIASLLSLDLIRKRAEDGLLRIHSWILNSETSEIESFNPSTREFAVLSPFWS